jgi:APA family basic amino acid/polyamine antiporter
MFLLSGLMIGPILGSGIIILPPVAYQVAGSWALPAWGVIILAGFLFAWIYGRLSILSPGPAGVANAIEIAFGSWAKKLSVYYLIGAVCFGPVAVMLTAARYIFPGISVSYGLVAIPLLLICSFILLQRVEFISGVALLFSSLAAVILFLGSCSVLLTGEFAPVATSPFSGADFGYTLLLLFWTIVGWEVVCNYSGEVRDPEKTIGRAVFCSAVVIACISLSVAGAMHVLGRSNPGNPEGVTAIVAVLFGRRAAVVMGMLTCVLCITTYLGFVGAVARMMCALAETNDLPIILRRKNRAGVPLAAISVLTCIHLLMLLAVCFGLLDIEKLIGLADGFFVGNALIGILVAAKLLDGFWLKKGAWLLAIVFSTILLNTSLIVLVVMAGMALLFFWCDKKNTLFPNSFHKV